MRRSLPLSLLLLLAPVALVSGCGSGNARRAETTAAVCRSVAMPEAKPDGTIRKPNGRLSSTVAWSAIVTTNCGTFTITLDAASSPRTTSSFAQLARAGFYDDLTFHRIARGFVIQGGDPRGDGSGGPGYTIAEPPPRNTRYVHGVVAMAKTATDPDGTSGSQFFIVTGDDAQLPPQYALLGEVTSGLDVIDRIDQRPLTDTDPQGSPPVDPVVIEHVAIRQG